MIKWTCEVESTAVRSAAGIVLHQHEKQHTERNQTALKGDSLSRLYESFLDPHQPGLAVSKRDQGTLERDKNRHNR